DELNSAEELPHWTSASSDWTEVEVESAEEFQDFDEVTKEEVEQQNDAAMQAPRFPSPSTSNLTSAYTTQLTKIQGSLDISGF
uniref:Clathrin light chain n=1 Tax=Mesocestoides corti TaxID=53468 RepID=A0A5K3F2R0_MESCO